MINTLQGNIVKADAEALVNTVNCVGIAGRGVALEFRKVFPENFKSYETACKRNEVVPGKMFIYEAGKLTFPRYIINFPTKRHWRGVSRIEDIEAGLIDLVKTVKQLEIKSIAIPPLGSGLGGLRWKTVRSKILEAFRDLSEVNVMLFEPWDQPIKTTQQNSTQAPRMTAGRAGLIGLMNHYLEGLLDPFITLLEVHKLMYFLQEAGQPLKLRYEKAPYGPYATNLRHVLIPVEGHYISGYSGQADKPNMELNLIPGAVEDAWKFLEGQPNTRTRLNKVDKLVDGFETPFGLELLSTVHWVVKRERPSDNAKMVAQVYSWGDRKKQFTEDQIDLAWSVLHTKGWT